MTGSAAARLTRVSPPPEEPDSAGLRAAVQPGARIEIVGTQPRADVLAAIVAAVEMVWPQPVSPAAHVDGLPGTTWRFSGRWWSVPPARRPMP